MLWLNKLVRLTATKKLNYIINYGRKKVYSAGPSLPPSLNSVSFKVEQEPKVFEEKKLQKWQKLESFTA